MSIQCTWEVKYISPQFINCECPVEGISLYRRILNLYSLIYLLNMRILWRVDPLLRGGDSVSNDRFCAMAL
jgi:hypothetical protein